MGNATTLEVVALVAGIAGLVVSRRGRQVKAKYFTLVQEIPLFVPGERDSSPRGRVDHLSCDPNRKLLFVACLGEDCVLVVDAFAGRVVHSLHEGLARPQGVLFVTATCRLYVANAADGLVTIFDAKSWVRLGSVDFGEEADNLRYSKADGCVYVGYGDGAIGVIDDAADFARRPQAEMTCGDDHPESFQLEELGEGRRIWVNVADSQELRVLDRASPNAPASRWSLPDGLAGNFPMAVDEASRIVFVGVRKPAHRSCVLILDMDSGDERARVSCPGDMDDLCFDRQRERLYVVSGTGCVGVLCKTPGGGSSTYSLASEVATGLGARTGFFYAQRDSLYVAAPAVGHLPARLLVFHGHG